MDWVSAVSALASVGSALFAWKTYRSAVDLKKHDFCLQLRTANATLRALVAELPGLLDTAMTSRERIDAADGMRSSGAAEKWRHRAEAVRGDIADIQTQLPMDDAFEAKGLSDLTGLITKTHVLHGRASALRAELEDALRRDDVRRQRLREDHRVELAALAAHPLKKTLGG